MFVTCLTAQQPRPPASLSSATSWPTSLLRHAPALCKLQQAPDLAHLYSRRFISTLWHRSTMKYRWRRSSSSVMRPWTAWTASWAMWLMAPAPKMAGKVRYVAMAVGPYLHGFERATVPLCVPAGSRRSPRSGGALAVPAPGGPCRLQRPAAAHLSPSGRQVLPHVALVCCQQALPRAC